MTSSTTDYLLVSDQSANQFKVYSREGGKSLNTDFKHGIFVAMSDDKTFQLYR
ncbi:MAG: hypothetical protein V4663_19450 [Bacteroidota bacterium]